MNLRSFNREVGRRHFLAAAATALAGTTWAQDYPIRPVRIILGFAAGGSGDALARIVSTEVSRQLGQPLVVENRPGAATNIASEAVARSAPDGYTLLLGGNFSHAVNPHLFGSKLPFDPVRDFTPVAKLTAGEGMVIVVPAGLPVNTLPEFVAYARKEGSKLNFASSGLSSPGHIAGGYVFRQANFKPIHQIKRLQRL